jgi:two-component system invasion response regulator UvrY
MIKVLLVDDHELIRIGMRRIIEDSAEFVIAGEASSGEEAMELARSERPNIVLMDINMPGMNGVEATRKLARLDNPPKIIIVSVHAQDPIPSRLLEAGASGYLTKEAAATELLSALKTVSKGKRYLSADVAREMALAQTDGTSPLASLSEREMEVLLLVADGKGIPDIAERLNVSPKTVSTYRYRLFEKLGVENDVELTRYALRHGLIEEMPADD